MGFKYIKFKYLWIQNSNSQYYLLLYAITLYLYGWRLQGEVHGALLGEPLALLGDDLKPLLLKEFLEHLVLGRESQADGHGVGDQPVLLLTAVVLEGLGEAAPVLRKVGAGVAGGAGGQLHGSGQNGVGGLD